MSLACRLLYGEINYVLQLHLQVQMLVLIKKVAKKRQHVFNLS